MKVKEWLTKVYSDGRREVIWERDKDEWAISPVHFLIKVVREAGKRNVGRFEYFITDGRLLYRFMYDMGIVKDRYSFEVLTMDEMEEIYHRMKETWGGLK